MLSLRQKLSLGFGGLLLIILIIGSRSVMLLGELGESIDVILRENYRSVVACQQMKEALERIDSGLLFVQLGYESDGLKLIEANEAAFDEALQVELNNITLGGEGAKAERVRGLFALYKSSITEITKTDVTHEAQRSHYFSKLLPLFNDIKSTSDEILHMNQQNMSEANDQARNVAASARRQMYFLLIVGVLIAGAFIFFIGRWILWPITRLIDSANQISAGNLDLVVKKDSNDEIGQLSEAFNLMAESLRRVRRTREAKLAQIQLTIQQAFDFLPDAVAVLDLEGKVEVATQTAAGVFGLRPKSNIANLPHERLLGLFQDVLNKGALIDQQNLGELPIQQFVDGEERYFSPKAIPILDRTKYVTGVMLVLTDVTQQRRQDDLKRGVISTVSHELQTPLTSVRMAIHLLLEEEIGALTPKQAEVLIAAEEDSERLYRILQNLLDIGRIESGKVHLNLQPVSTHTLVLDSVEPFRSTSKGAGVNLVVDLPDDLPDVMADMTRAPHVFANLCSNALKYTKPGGEVIVSAYADDAFVYLSVSDTGKGIPERYLDSVFEQFFRIPDHESETGAGLGLAIAKEIVRAHGGDITVSSRKNEGSTFTFSLKRADSYLGKDFKHG